MALRPFESIEKPPAENLPALTSYVHRLLGSELGKLHFTAQGADISQQGEGNVHFNIHSSGDITHPFKVAQANNGFQISPGLIYCHSIGGWTAPQIAGTDLTASNRPTLVWGSADVLICLVVEFAPDGTAMNLPWQIRGFTSKPSDEYVRRLNGSSTEPRPGKYHVLIASRANGVFYQWAMSNLVVNLQWEQLFVSA